MLQSFECSLGKLTVEDELGRGTFGVVYKASDECGNRFAAKFCTRETLEQRGNFRALLREVKILQRLTPMHPCLNKLYALHASPHGCWLVLQYAEGGNLYDVLRRNPSGLNPSLAFTVVWQLISALSFMHSQSVCHRDIKPENILLDSSKNVQLADFGFAKVVHSLTRTRCGSPHYVAPEVYSGHSYDGKKADVWSVGVVIFAIYTSTLPFLGSTQAVFESARKGIVPYPKWFGDSLKDLLGKMINPRVEERIEMSDVFRHPFWITNCKRYNLNEGGCHTLSALRGDSNKNTVVEILPRVGTEDVYAILKLMNSQKCQLELSDEDAIGSSASAPIAGPASQLDLPGTANSEPGPSSPTRSQSADVHAYNDRQGSLNRKTSDKAIVVQTRPDPKHRKSIAERIAAFFSLKNKYQVSE